jgi:hypothetical protein
MMLKGHLIQIVIITVEIRAVSEDLSQPGGFAAPRKLRIVFMIPKLGSKTQSQMMPALTMATIKGRKIMVVESVDALGFIRETVLATHRQMTRSAGTSITTYCRVTFTERIKSARLKRLV